jgi:DNA replication and repair protein RecF
LVLKKVTLDKFRNYENTQLSFNGNFNFIYGNNGQGKTNLLEAISFFSFGKSFLAVNEQDCIKFGYNDFRISGEFENDIGNNYTVTIDYCLLPKKKAIYLNNEKVGSFGNEIFGRFPLVYLSPHSLNISYGNPSERRKFFDILIAETNKVYFDFLKKFTRLLKQKNALLKDNLQNRKISQSDFENILESYNINIIDLSANIIFRRLNFLNEFNGYYQNNFVKLTEDDCESCINYYSEATGEIEHMEFKNFTIEKLSEIFTGFLKEKYQEEIQRGQMLFGPQRDDFIFRLKKKDEDIAKGFEIKNFASQGEHKTAIITLKLAEFHYLKDKTSTNPILLLDDVLSELDSGRIFRVISHLKEYGQILLTTTEEGHSGSLKKYYNESEFSTYKINKGIVATN